MISPFLAGLILFVLGIVFALISFLIQRSVFKHMDDIKILIEGIRNDFSIFKDEVMRDFVRKDDFDKNDEAHKNLWDEINKLRERVAKHEGQTSGG